MPSCLRTLALISTAFALNACVTNPATPPAPVETRSRPAAGEKAPPPVAEPSRPVAPPPAPIIVTPLPPLPPKPPAPPPPPPPPPAPPVPAYMPEAEGRAMVEHLIAPEASDRAGWAADIFRAFAALRLPPTRENFCSAIAVIEQESSFRSDPAVPGLPKIVWQELYKKAERYHVPSWTVDVAMLKPSRDGRSYRARINALRTEKDVNALYQELVAALPDMFKSLGGRNPIRTAGPMQVSVDFAEQQVREKPYPYARAGSVRDEVFSRRGGVYFGIAMLLDYAAPYPQAVFRFADYNAGRFSSRNAAFQAAVSILTHRKLDLDGDLLRYADGALAREQSSTTKALMSLAPRLGLTPAQIDQDIRQEKAAAFQNTATWKRVFALAEAVAKKPLPRERLPGIALKSPKIHRKLTTAWFAERVDGRYQTCLTRH